MQIFFLLLAISKLSLGQTPSDLIIQVNGEKKKVLEGKAIQQSKLTTVDYYNQNTHRSETYRGILFSELMEKAIGEEAKNIVEVEFISSDGYDNFISMDSLLKVPAVLTFERADGEKFVRYSQKLKSLVSLGPYYLVWDLKKVSKDEAALYSSDYEITTINFITKHVDFGVHEGDVDANLFLGYRTYKKYCLTCHAVSKKGGSIGPDLMEKKIVDTKGTDYLVKYMLEPQSVNPKTKMLPLPRFNNSKAMALGVVEFLTFMKNPEEILKKQKAKKDRLKYQELSDLVQQMKEGK